MIGSLPGFEANEYIRAGFEMTFSGNEPNADGEPEGSYVQVVLTVPPLSFYHLQKIQAKQKSRAAPATAEELNADVVDTVFYALKRNYKGIPRWLIEQSLDAPMMSQLNAKMREMAGFTDSEKKA